MTIPANANNSRQYRRDIDGLRAVAVLGVILYHLFPDFLPGGFVGVDVFFVISGFLITQMTWLEIEAGSFSFCHFYSRRILRLYPALILILLVFAGFSGLVLNWSEREHFGKQMMAGALFFSNFALWFEGGYFDIAADRKPLLHLWSLSIEEQFYLVWPIFLALAYKIGFRFSLVAATLGTSSLVLGVYLTYVDPIAGFYNPAARFWELVLGGSLGVFSATTRYRPPSRPGSALMSLGGIVGLWLTSVILTRESTFPGLVAIVPCVCAISILASDPNNPFSRRFLGNRLMVAIGLISYPLYLWHWPLWSFTYLSFQGQVPEMARVIIFLASWILACATYALVERPLRRGEKRGTKALALLGGMLILAGIGFLSWSSEGFIRWSRVVSDATFLSRVITQAEWSDAVREGPCYLQVRTGGYHADTCKELRRPSVVLWGDSHAASLYPGLKELQAHMSFGITQMTQGACPPFRDAQSKYKTDCDQINANILNTVTEMSPDVVILSAAWIHHEYPHTNEQIVAKLSDMVRVVKTHSPTSRIIIIGTLPRWAASDSSEGLPSLLRDYVSQKGRTPPVYFAKPDTRESTRLRDLDEMLVNTASDLGATFIRPADVFCTTSGCLTRVSDTPEGLVTFDYAHLSSSGSKFFITHIRSKIFNE